jgi:aminotransferase
MTSNEFSKRLLGEEKVAVIPGNAFGQCGEGFVRCSYVASLEDIEEALERMGRFVKRDMVDPKLSCPHSPSISKQ